MSASGGILLVRWSWSTTSLKWGMHFIDIPKRCEGNEGIYASMWPIAFVRCSLAIDFDLCLHTIHYSLHKGMMSSSFGGGSLLAMLWCMQADASQMCCCWAVGEGFGAALSLPFSIFVELWRFCDL